MITNDDINVLYAYLSLQTLEPESDIKKVYDKITLIKEIMDKQEQLRDL